MTETIVYDYDKKTKELITSRILGLQLGDAIPENYTTEPLPQGIFKPKFNKKIGQWEEQLSDDEIKEILGKSNPKTLIEKLEDELEELQTANSDPKISAKGWAKKVKKGKKSIDDVPSDLQEKVNNLLTGSIIE